MNISHDMPLSFFSVRFNLNKYKINYNKFIQMWNIRKRGSNVFVFIRNILGIRLTNCQKINVLKKYICMIFCLLNNLFNTYQLHFARQKALLESKPRQVAATYEIKSNVLISVWTFICESRSDNLSDAQLTLLT